MDAAAKRKYLNAEVFSMTLAATAQRSHMYSPGLSEKDRRPFQKSLRAALESLAETYSAKVTEQQHVRNITRLANRLSRKHPALLNDRRMKIGHAQKALNLYLKYMWCLDKLPMPPHCPLDSIILKRIPGFTQVHWTQLDSPERYERIISAAKAKAKQRRLPLAIWELHEYNGSDT